MTQSLEDFAAANQPQPQREHPSGWEPSITWNETEGTISTGPLEAEPDPAVWANLIKDWGLNPDLTEVVDGSVQLRAWDANVGDGVIKRLFYYRASIRARRSQEAQVDVEDLIRQIENLPGIDYKAVVEDFNAAVVALLSDWQVGKGEGGGTAATIARIKQSVLNLKAHIAYLQSVGRGPSAIYLIGLGDMIEGCSGHYAMQTFQADLDRRGQVKVVRHLIMWIIEELVPLALPIVLGAVPGNHGENRKGGKAYTTLQDNDDLAVFEQVAEILAANEWRYGNVHVPLGAIADDLTMTLDVSGVNVGFAHGHQMNKGGATAQAKTEEWWRGQAMGGQPVADAKILFKGHLHHLVVSEATGRTMFQCPAQDGGSGWWRDVSGSDSSAGMLVVSVGTSYGERGWGDMQVL